MADTLRVKLVANAGLLLEYEGITFLLDGIFGDEKHPFSNYSQSVWQAILEKEAPFEHIDYLLFTHVHPDHFSPELTVELLKKRSVRGVFFPDADIVGSIGLPEMLQQKGIPCAILSDQTNHIAVKVGPHISVRGFRTLHLDKKFDKVRHYCYLVTFGDKKILFTADMDYISEDLSCLGHTALSAAFINPLFFSALRHGKYFRGKLNTRRICVYHVPFAEDDTMDLRGMLTKDIAQWPADRAWVTALTEPFQEIRL